MDSHERKPLDEEIDVFGITNAGKVRKNNEDHYLICSLEKHMKVHSTSLKDLSHLPLKQDRLAYLLLVADGAGGHAAGEEASRLTLETAARYMTYSMQCYYTADAKQEDTFLKDMNSAILECHSMVLKDAKQHPDWRGMAATLTLFMSIWPRAYVVQIGDSRCYQLREGVLRQITKDQTIAQHMVDEGLLEPDTAGHSRWSNVLSSAIGGADAMPVTTKIDMQWGDVIMLCSDGLSKHVSDEEIRKFLNQPTSSEEICKSLVNDALEKGGTDNITVVIGRINPAIDKNQ